jgi:hypothetical protein
MTTRRGGLIACVLSLAAIGAPGSEAAGAPRGSVFVRRGGGAPPTRYVRRGGGAPPTHDTTPGRDSESDRIAPGVDLFVCEDHGFVLNGCALRPGTLAAPVADIDGHAVETEYALEYEFPCAGNPVHVGVASGASQAEFRQGAVGDALSGIVGDSSLRTHDPDPASTRQRSFQPGCRLTVTRVTALPSAGTIRLLQAQAGDEARVLASSLMLYELGKDYAALASWSAAKLTLLHDRLAVLVTSDPENLSFRTMLKTVEAALKNAPAPVTAEELRVAGDAMVQALRASLDAEVAKGARLVAQFDQWHLTVEAALEEALGTIAAH